MSNIDILNELQRVVLDTINSHLVFLPLMLDEIDLELVNKGRGT